MKVRILGCSGGIGGRDLRTTALLVDDDILIDAGTGVADLSLAELALIDHVFITHSHLDHIASLPLMIDSVADQRDKPITVYATEPTLAVLRTHIFNWVIWPDFSEISLGERAAMIYRPICVGEKIALADRLITALPAEHTVPAVGYHLSSGAGSLVYTGDTTLNETLWPIINAIADLRYLLIETAFANDGSRLAVKSKHLCPSMLGGELARLSAAARQAQIYITHLKPGQSELIMDEIGACAGQFNARVLYRGQVFEF